MKSLNEEISKFIVKNLSNKTEEFSEINKNINLSKNEKLPEMDYIMIEASFRFNNLFWNNSTAYVKINDEYHWMEHHDWETSNCNTDNWVSPIRIILKGKEINNGNINIIFGIKPDISLEKINKMEKCELKDFDFSKWNIAEFINLKVSIK